MSGLTLSRKAGETIQIGDDIRIDIHEVHGGRVKLQINAPPHVVISRYSKSEIPVKMVREKNVNRLVGPGE